MGRLSARRERSRARLRAHQDKWIYGDTFTAWVYDYIRAMEKESMSYLRGPIGQGPMFDSDQRMDRRGFTPTATFVTKPKLIDVQWKPWMPTHGLERVNAALFQQTALWVDGDGRVYDISKLNSGHLERLIAWMEGGRNYLKQYRDITVVRSPLHVALCKERDRRWKQQKEEEKKQKTEMQTDLSRFEQNVLPKLNDLLAEYGYKAVKDA